MQLNNNRIMSPVQSPQSLQGQGVQAPNGDNFQNIMEGYLQHRDVQFSKHANTRLSDRNIELNPAQMQRLEQGVQKAQTKGIRDSLVLIDNIALIVNIKNKMVVTAINQNDQVFTNIDGAVIV